MLRNTVIVYMGITRFPAVLKRLPPFFGRIHVVNVQRYRTLERAHFQVQHIITHVVLGYIAWAILYTSSVSSTLFKDIGPRGSPVGSKHGHHFLDAHILQSTV